VDLLRHLRLFVTVAEELHFSRAADRLGMAQPPLSQAVRRLEKELGAELFDRAHRRIRLTAAGVVLLDETRELLAREERLRVLTRDRTAALSRDDRGRPAAPGRADGAHPEDESTRPWSVVYAEGAVRRG
jgi:DNA-binding transcriptional LysR family regulator